MFSNRSKEFICSFDSVLLLIEKEMEVTDPCIFSASHRNFLEEHSVNEMSNCPSGHLSWLGECDSSDSDFTTCFSYLQSSVLEDSILRSNSTPSTLVEHKNTFHF